MTAFTDLFYSIFLLKIWSHERPKDRLPASRDNLLSNYRCSDLDSAKKFSNHKAIKRRHKTFSTSRAEKENSDHNPIIETFAIVENIPKFCHNLIRKYFSENVSRFVFSSDYNEVRTKILFAHFDETAANKKDLQLFIPMQLFHSFFPHFFSFHPSHRWEGIWW